MKPVVSSLCLALLMAACSVAHADAAIEAAARDYIEGWYAGDAARMANALHPDLVKRIVVPRNGRSELQEMTADELIAATGNGGGQGTPPNARRTDVQVLDVFGDVASVRVDAGEWIDYMHLARWNGEWKVVNVLWALRAE